MTDYLPFIFNLLGRDSFRAFTGNFLPLSSLPGWDPMPEQRKILDPILDYRLNASYAEMKFNVPFVWKTAGKLLLILLLIIGTILLVRLRV